MRTTLSIDDDILDKAKAVAASQNTPFRFVINDALRAGLDKVEKPRKTSAYCTIPHEMRLKAGKNLDNIQELLAQVEGEDYK
ncbi:MAG: DUF2191 domain-containing protein [Myxococcota bacterium]|jgi:hypothetical protein